jgi:hypothetical protein
LRLVQYIQQVSSSFKPFEKSLYSAESFPQEFGTARPLPPQKEFGPAGPVCEVFRTKKLMKCYRDNMIPRNIAFD